MTNQARMKKVAIIREVILIWRNSVIGYKLVQISKNINEDTRHIS